MDRPDAIGQCGRHRRLPSSPVGHHAGLEGGGAARPVACRAIARSVRGYCAGYLARGASEATHLGRESAVRAVALHHCAQQADRRAASPLPATLFLMSLGPRPDIATAMHNPFCDLKFLVTLALASVAAALSLHLSRPNASLHGWMWLFALPLGLLGIGIAADFAVPQRVNWTGRLVGSNSMACMSAIPLFSAPFLLAALLMLRKCATSRPMLMGSFAGLMSAGLGATLYAAHCMDDSPLFVATWYTLAAAFVTFAGAMIGRRVLRF